MHGFIDLITLTYINGDKLSLEKKKIQTSIFSIFVEVKKKGVRIFGSGIYLITKMSQKDLCKCHRKRLQDRELFFRQRGLKIDHHHWMD